MNSRIVIALVVIAVGMFGLWLPIPYSGWVLAAGLWVFLDAIA